MGRISRLNSSGLLAAFAARAKLRLRAKNKNRYNPGTITASTKLDADNRAPILRKINRRATPTPDRFHRAWVNVGQMYGGKQVQGMLVPLPEGRRIASACLVLCRPAVLKAAHSGVWCLRS